MIFIRIVVNHTRNCVNAVLRQDVPFDGANMHPVGEEWEVVDLGMVEDHVWTDRDGNPCTPCRHILQRLEDAKLGSHELVAHGVQPHRPDPRRHPLAPVVGVRDIIDVPCTVTDIQRRLAQHTARALPGKVRAWLALTLPPHVVASLGLGAVPIPVLKAMERIRHRRDPRSGSRLFVFERMAQERSDADAHRRHFARRRRHAVALEREVEAACNALPEDVAARHGLEAAATHLAHVRGASHVQFVSEAIRVAERALRQAKEA